MNTLDIYTRQDIHEYLNICDKIKCHVKCDWLYEEILDQDELRVGCEFYVIELINYAFKCKPYALEDGLYGACKGGNMAIAEMMIDKGAKCWNHGLYGACVGVGSVHWKVGNKHHISKHHIDIIEFMIKKGANDFGLGIYNASYEGHIEIVKLLIGRGETDYNIGLVGACNGGHIEIVKMMIDKGAKCWDIGLQSACNGGHTEIVKMIIEKGATMCQNCGKSMDEHKKMK